jgi:serine/threonine-protein kinase
VHSRILFGAAAWLLGAATATTGSLLTVSLLGQGITGNSGQLLTQDAVNNALASEAAQGSAPAAPAVTASVATSRPQATATPSPSATSASPGPMPAATAVSPPAWSPSRPTASSAAGTTPATTTTAPPASSGGAVLTSAGGQVVATCQAAGAYLISWSPVQGYEVGDVIRGPAATARVTFESRANHVTMVVTCSAGVPSATSHTGIDT